MATAAALAVGTRNQLEVCSHHKGKERTNLCGYGRNTTIASCYRKVLKKC